MPNLSDTMAGAAGELGGDEQEQTPAPQPAASVQQPAPAATPAPPVQKPDTDPLLASKASPKRIAMPSGAVLETPPSWSDGVIETLARELHSATQTVMGIPGAVYHAAADPETAEEAARYGKGSMKKVGPTGRLILRSAVTPTEVAIEDYSHGRVTPDAALDVAPEALGSAAGSVIAGKTAEPAGRALRQTLTPGAEVTEAAPAAVKATPKAAPLSEVESAANAYIRRNRLVAPKVEQVTGSADEEPGVVNLGGKTVRTAGQTPAQSNLPDVDVIRKLLKDNFGDAAPEVELHDPDNLQSQPRASSEVEDAEANKYLRQLEEDATPSDLDRIQMIRKRLGLVREPGEKVGGEPKTAPADLKARAQMGYQYRKVPGEVLDRHVVDILDNNTGDNKGQVSAIETDPGQWTIDNTRSDIKGAHVGREGYAKMMRAAQDEANNTGHEITVQGGGSQTDAAVSTWKGLQKEYPDIKWADSASGTKRPSITFRPDPKSVTPDAPKPAAPPLPKLDLDPDSFLGKWNQIVDKHYGAGGKVYTFDPEFEKLTETHPPDNYKPEDK